MSEDITIGNCDLRHLVYLPLRVWLSNGQEPSGLSKLDKARLG